MKRRIYFLYIIWVQVVAISLSSCDDELTDIHLSIRRQRQMCIRDRYKWLPFLYHRVMMN